MQATAVDFMGAIAETMPDVLGWIGDVVDALLTGELAALLPLVAIGIVVSVVMLGIRVIRSFTWGA